MARDDKIIIRVSEEMKSKFQNLAESMGMTMSSLGAYVIGKYMREEIYKREMQDKLLKDLTPQFMETINNVDINDPVLLKTVSDTIAKLVSEQDK